MRGQTDSFWVAAVSAFGWKRSQSPPLLRMIGDRREFHWWEWVKYSAVTIFLRSAQTVRGEVAREKGEIGRCRGGRSVWPGCAQSRSRG